MAFIVRVMKLNQDTNQKNMVKTMKLQIVLEVRIKSFLDTNEIISNEQFGFW